MPDIDVLFVCTGNTCRSPMAAAWLAHQCQQANLDVSIASASITTLGERVEDVFYVTDKDGKPVTDESTIRRIENYIAGELDQYTQKAS